MIKPNLISLYNLKISTMTYRFLTLFILLISCTEVLSQQLSESKPIMLKLDRNGYISGDDILFSIYQYDGLFKEDIPGNDIFLDMTTIENEWITGTIVKQSDGTASGMLNIPDTLPTNYYRVRAYTKHPNIDNYYCYKEVFINNRFGKSTMPVSRTTNNNASHVSTAQIISTDKSEYTTNDVINLNIAYTDTVNALIRIIANEQFQNELQAVYGKCDNTNIEQSYSSITPYDGIIVSGKVKDKFTDLPITNAIVLVSLQDSIVRLKYDITDTTGSFCVLLHNYYGSQHIFVNAFNEYFEPYFNTKIELDNQYYTGSIEGNAIFEAETKIDSNGLNKAIISKAFETQQYSLAEINNRPDNLYDHFIVGTPKQTINTDDYIALDDFKELTRELLPFVRIRKNKDKQNELLVIPDYGSYLYNPLLLVDGVPLTKLEKIMDMGSDKIKKIETQNSIRHFGNIAFNNGIVIVWTHKHDFWEKCHVPGTHSFFVQNFQQPVVVSETNSEPKDKLPNLKQTIYWNPNFNTELQNSIEIPLSDETGEFVIEFFGIGSDGKYVRDFKLINVK